MYFIKLDAIDSTNDYLKKISSEMRLENFTVVSAKHQSKGKGQLGSIWTAESSKNLTFSILLKDLTSQIEDVFLLNKVVALSLFQFLEQCNVPNVKIKWPNDIMAGSKKIAGVLIENNFRHNGTIDCIVGIGLNVNQKIFGDLVQATSIFLETEEENPLDELLVSFCELFQKNLKFYQYKSSVINENYNQLLFKREKPAVFKGENGQNFMGIIKRVDEHGALELMLEDDTLKKFKLKEIKMLF
ncbi:MAG: biotin--[acetyl-CoA-carboxylase] ligase [Flavobacterium sp.]